MQCPDLNPFEKLRKQVDAKVRLHCRFRNDEELYQELQTARSQIKLVRIDKLTECMPRRCTKVIKNNRSSVNELV